MRDRRTRTRRPNNMAFSRSASLRLSPSLSALLSYRHPMSPARKIQDGLSLALPLPPSFCSGCSRPRQLCCSSALFSSCFLTWDWCRTRQAPHILQTSFLVYCHECYPLHLWPMSSSHSARSRYFARFRRLYISCPKLFFICLPRSLAR